MTRSAITRCPGPARSTVSLLLVDLVLAVSVAACGGGGGGGVADIAGAPLAQGPTSAPSPAVAPTPAPPASLATQTFRIVFTDATGQAGASSLNSAGQVAYTSATANGETGRFFDGTTLQQVAGNAPARVTAVNESGQVTGFLLQDPDTRAFVWTPSVFTYPLLDRATGTSTVTSGINRSGQVAGTEIKRGVAAAFRWTPGTPPLVEGLAAIGPSGTAPPTSNALFINASGTVAGASSSPTAPMHAALWVPGQPVRDLGTLGGANSSVAGLNDANQVVGEADLGAGVHHAYRWTPAEGMRDLGTLGGPLSAASAINASGTVTGTASAADGRSLAFVWRDGAMTSLGTLGGNGSAATAINASGVVGGSASMPDGTSHAFLWTATEGMVDLNTRLKGDGRPVLQSVIALADNGAVLVSSSAGLVLLRPEGGP